MICMRKQGRKMLGKRQGAARSLLSEASGPKRQAGEGAVAEDGETYLPLQCQQRRAGASERALPRCLSSQTTAALLPAACPSHRFSPHRPHPKFSCPPRTSTSAPGAPASPPPRAHCLPDANAASLLPAASCSCNLQPSATATPAQDSLRLRGASRSLPVPARDALRRPCSALPRFALAPALPASPASLRPLCCLESAGSSAV